MEARIPRGAGELGEVEWLGEAPVHHVAGLAKLGDPLHGNHQPEPYRST